jgi:hypothetical protein
MQVNLVGDGDTLPASKHVCKHAGGVATRATVTDASLHDRYAD